MDRWLSVARLWFRSTFLPAYVNRDLDDELRFHIDEQAAEFMAAGMTEEDAREAAHARLGDTGTVKRRTRTAADEALQESLDEWRSKTMLPRRINLKAVVATLVVLGAIGGFAVGKMTKPLYSSTAVLSATPSEPVPGFPPTAGPAVAQRLQTMQTVVLSRTRLERIVEELDLYPALRKSTTMEEVVEEMRSHIELTPGPDRTFSVRFTGEDPTQVMRVTEKLAAYFKDESAIQEEKASASTISYLEMQVREVGDRLGAHEAQAKAAGTTESRRVKLEAGVLESTYTRLLTSLEEARGRSRANIGEKFILVDNARKPEQPITPTPMHQAWLGALTGFSSGIAIALLVLGMRFWRGRPPASLAISS